MHVYKPLCLALPLLYDVAIAVLPECVAGLFLLLVWCSHADSVFWLNENEK